MCSSSRRVHLDLVYLVEIPHFLLHQQKLSRATPVYVHLAQDVPRMPSTELLQSKPT
jgi:hypothetical protein